MSNHPFSERELDLLERIVKMSVTVERTSKDVDEIRATIRHQDADKRLALIEQKWKTLLVGLAVSIPVLAIISQFVADVLL